MRVFRFIILGAYSLLIFCSCSILGEENSDDITAGDIHFETDQSFYISHQDYDEPWPTYRFTLIARLENRSNQTIYLDRCRANSPQPMYGFKLLNAQGSERAGYGKVYACVGHNQPITVQAGSVRVDTIGRIKV